MIAVCGRNGYWKKALRISCALHLAVISAVGTAASNWVEADVLQERYIAVELSAIEERSSIGAATVQHAEKPSAPPSRQPSIPSNKATQAFVHTDSSRGRASHESVPVFSGSGGSSGAYGDAGKVGGDAMAGNAEIGEIGGAGQAEIAAADRMAVMDRFVSRVEAHKEYPYMALKRNQEGRPVVYVELDAEGNLISAALSVSSGISSLDNAAIKAVRSACPYRHGLGEALSMEVPVRYQLTGA